MLNLHLELDEGIDATLITAGYKAGTGSCSAQCLYFTTVFFFFLFSFLIGFLKRKDFYISAFKAHKYALSFG